MRNKTTLTHCPSPFIDSSLFPPTGGYIPGRACGPLVGDLVCCLPCPVTDYVYDKRFATWHRTAESIDCISIIFCIFLLLTYIFIPVEKSKRHYLSVCLVIGVLTEAIGFVIPLFRNPQQCYNKITPNDMYTSLPCAWSGALIVAGGLTVTIWIFVRALSMHLQICWDIMTGRRFFYIVQAFGWGLVSLLFILTIGMTGVSFRFGHACHVNSSGSMQTFWGPLLGTAGASTLIQLLTFLYCFYVYVKNIWSVDAAAVPLNKAHDSSTLTSSLVSPYSVNPMLEISNPSPRSSLHPSATSPHSQPPPPPPPPAPITLVHAHHSNGVSGSSARTVYHRVKKVVWLQWRAMLIVVFILADVIFFSVVFVYYNDATQHINSTKQSQYREWVTCILQNGGANHKCLTLGQKLVVSQDIAVAVLMLLAIPGIQTFLTIFRWSMFTGWYELIHQKFVRKHEFISFDAKHMNAVLPPYELPHVPPQMSSSPLCLSYSLKNLPMHASPTKSPRLSGSGHAMSPQMQLYTPNDTGSMIYFGNSPTPSSPNRPGVPGGVSSSSTLDSYLLHHHNYQTNLARSQSPSQYGSSSGLPGSRLVSTPSPSSPTCSPHLPGSHIYFSRRPSSPTTGSVFSLNHRPLSSSESSFQKTSIPPKPVSVTSSKPDRSSRISSRRVVHQSASCSGSTSQIPASTPLRGNNLTLNTGNGFCGNFVQAYPQGHSSNIRQNYQRFSLPIGVAAGFSATPSGTNGSWTSRNSDTHAECVLSSRSLPPPSATVISSCASSTGPLSKSVNVTSTTKATAVSVSGKVERPFRISTNSLPPLPPLPSVATSPVSTNSSHASNPINATTTITPGPVNVVNSDCVPSSMNDESSDRPASSLNQTLDGQQSRSNE